MSTAAFKIGYMKSTVTKRNINLKESPNLQLSSCTPPGQTITNTKTTALMFTFEIIPIRNIVNARLAISL